MRIIALALVVLCCTLTGCKGERGDTELVAAFIDPTVEPDEFLRFINKHPDPDPDPEKNIPSQIDTVDYANKYYETVDPGNQRTTLEAWKANCNFDPDPTSHTHATFRDTKDLGYGRDMYAWQTGGGDTCIYVDNYVVELEPGDATTYGPLNLDAAIVQDRRYHIRTNAIEFSPDPTNPADRIAKFFTFAPRNTSGDQQRITADDQDGRGVKHMPTMCMACHGGTMYPLTNDGKFNPISLKSAKLHMLEQDTFQFSPLAGFTQDDQEDNIQAINEMIYETYVDAGTREDEHQDLGAMPAIPADQANWDSGFAERLVELAYSDPTPGDGTLDQVTSYTTDNIPAGWIQTPSRRDGVETLYRRVIGPYCIGCHTLRGTQVAGDIPNAVNFSSYEQFKSVNDQNIDHVYRRGTMPLSLITYEQFWSDPDDLPGLLASYLDGFDVFDPNGKIVRPGKAVAIPGADREVASPAKLKATASLFSTSYAWEIDSTTDPAAELDDPSSSAPKLTAANDAMVVLKLTTANAKGESEPVDVTITIDDSLDPKPVFVTNPTDTDDGDIVDVFVIVDDSGSANCVTCHHDSYSSVVPVYFNKDDDYPDPPSILPNNEMLDKKDLYRNVRDRINLNDPENSLLLRKAIGDQHGGGPRWNLNTPFGKDNYNTILNWIRNGAPCGDDPTYCDIVNP